MVENKVKLLLSANRKSYMPRRLAQQRMTLSDLEWPFHASRAISVGPELLVPNYTKMIIYIRLLCLAITKNCNWICKQ